MKRAPVISEQRWLLQPSAEELRRRNATLAAWLFAEGVVALLGWLFFAWAVLLR